MDATEFIIPKTESIFINWQAGAAEVLTLSTFDLISLFGIPEGKQIELISVDYTSDTTETAINMGVDTRLKQSLTTPEGIQEATRNNIQLSSGDVGHTYNQPLHDMPLTDELTFRETIGAGALWTIMIFFRFVRGSMYLIDDLAINVGDITQVTPDRSPGSEWFQVGPVSQIGSTEFGN